MDNLCRNFNNSNTNLSLLNEERRVLEKIDQIKQNFINIYKDNKDFLDCGIGKMYGDYVLYLYVKDYNCSLVENIKRKGSSFERVPVRIFETGEIKAL